MVSRQVRQRARPPDLETVLTTIDQFYAAATDGTVELWQAVFDACSGLLDTETGGFYCTDKRNESADIARLRGLDLQRALATYQHYGVAADLLYTGSLELPADTTFLGSELIGQPALMASPFFDAVTRPAGVQFVLGALVENDPDQHSLMCFWHTASQGDFDEAARRTLARLMPHVRRAAQVHRRLLGASVSAEEARHLTVATFQHSRHGILALDRGGRVIFQNRESERITGAGDGISIQAGRLRAADVRADLALGRALAPGVLPGPPLRVPRPSGELPYEALLMPVTDPAQRSILPRGTSYLMVLTDPTTFFDVSEERLRGFGLTPAEARLCRALVRTGSLPKAAAALTISPGTARTHLKRVFSKLGVASQVELMGSLLSGYPGPPPTG